MSTHRQKIKIITLGFTLSTVKKQAMEMDVCFCVFVTVLQMNFTVGSICFVYLARSIAMQGANMQMLETI